MKTSASRLTASSACAPTPPADTRSGPPLKTRSDLEKTRRHLVKTRSDLVLLKSDLVFTPTAAAQRQPENHAENRAAGILYAHAVTIPGARGHRTSVPAAKNGHTRGPPIFCRRAFLRMPAPERRLKTCKNHPGLRHLFVSLSAPAALRQSRHTSPQKTNSL